MTHYLYRTFVPTVYKHPCNTPLISTHHSSASVTFIQFLTFLFALLLLFNSLASSLSQSNNTPTPQINVERGITGTYRFTYGGKPLKAKPQRSSDAPIGMRLSTVPSDNQTYEAKFLGNKEGTYDLRSLMEHVDGAELTDVPPILVAIVSTLPKDHRSDLFESTTFKPKVWGGYRLSICLLGVIWLSIPVAVFVRRSMRPIPIAPKGVVVALPTFADQIKPLVEAAAAKTLSVRDKGRLELLLLHYWRERISLESVDMVTAIGKLRQHPEAGKLISAVERWLHQSELDADYPDHSTDSILELLKPYQTIAITKEELSLATVGDATQ